jgi:hypothetical protein
MSVERMRVVIAKAGTRIGTYAVVTSHALKEMAQMANNPHITFNEELGELVWEGPADAYYDYFMHPAAVQEASVAINRAMRK